MAFQDSYDLTSNSVFQVKVHMAVLKSALAVVGEAAGTMGAGQLSKRHDLGAAVLIGGTVNGVAHTPADIQERFRWAVAGLDTITGASSDSDVEWAVNSIWDDLAAVKASEKV